MPVHEALRAELVRLRQGRGLQERLAGRVGDRLAELCGAEPGESDRVLRRKVLATLTHLARDLPDDLRRAAELTFAFDAAMPATLSQRIARLAAEIHSGDRTARRRMDEAVQLMAEAGGSARGPAGPDPGPGWRVRRFEALLRLDTGTPQLYETRVVLADRPMDRLEIRLDLPRTPGAGDPALPLAVEALYGARVTEVHRSGEGGRHYRLAVRLPRLVQPGDPLEFCLHYRVPPGQPIRDHYAIVPLEGCDAGWVRVRFSPARPPARVWSYAAVPPRQLDEAATRPGPDVLRPDDVGEVVLAFRGLRQGHAYGAAWSW